MTSRARRHPLLRDRRRPAALSRDSPRAGRHVTIVGRALPFGDLPDPDGADVGDGTGPAARRSRDRRGPRGGARGRARSWTTRPRPGATPRSRGSGSAARSVRPTSTPRRIRCPSLRPRTPRGSSGRSTSRPTTLVLAASRRGPAAHRARDAGRRGGPRTVRLPARVCWGQAWPSSVRWSSPSCSAEASDRDPTGGRRDRAPSGSSIALAVFIGLSNYNAVDRPAAARGQGLGEHRCRAQAAPRHAAEPRRRRPRPHGLRTGRADGRHRGSRRVLPHRPDPGPGRDLGPDDRRGPVALRGRRALPGHQGRRRT